MENVENRKKNKSENGKCEQKDNMEKGKKE